VPWEGRSEDKTDASVWARSRDPSCAAPTEAHDSPGDILKR